MLIDVFKIIITSALLAFPFALYNAFVFHNKKYQTENVGLFVRRFLFSFFVGLIFSCMVTHLTLFLKSDHDSLSWVFYPVGFFCCTPYFMNSMLKERNDLDHFFDGIGFLSSLLGFILVIAFWESFFSDPHRAGFIFEFSFAIKSI